MDKSLYARPAKPRTMQVNRRSGAPAMALPVLPEAMEVDRYTQCHTTPLDVAARMVSYLGPARGALTLEPSAGTGNLLQALFDSGLAVNELVAIERHYNLCNCIRTRFSGDQTIDPIQRCFLEYAEEAEGKIEYSQIIMNPPFRAVRKHMKAALSLLGFGGHDAATLIALVPMTYTHEDTETIEELGRDTFSTATVSSKIIRIEYRISEGNR